MTRAEDINQGDTVQFCDGVPRTIKFITRQRDFATGEVTGLRWTFTDGEKLWVTPGAPTFVIGRSA